MPFSKKILQSISSFLYFEKDFGGYFQRCKSELSRISDQATNEYKANKRLYHKYIMYTSRVRLLCNFNIMYYLQL